jgi:hypothetical protein
MRAAYPEAPDEADNDVREDGTACHWLAAETWEGRHHPEGTLSPNNRVIDEDMFDAVDMYHDVLRSWEGVVPVIEKQIPCDVIFPGMAGTPDAWAYNPTTRTLYIADLKYGFRFVEVWDNWQLLVYVAALLELLNINGLMDQNLIVQMTIVQPRSSHRDGPVRTRRVRASELRAAFNTLRAAAAEAMKDDPACTPNPHCGDCAGRHACVALQNSALGALETSYAGVPLELTPAAIGDELRRLKEGQARIEARLTGLQGQAETLIRNGTVVPHWTLETTFARERWREGTEAQVLTLGHLMGQDLGKPQQPISPARARKLVPAAMLAGFAHKPSTGVRLAKQDPLQARKKFSEQP